MLYLKSINFLRFYPHALRWQKGGQRLMENKPVTPAAQALAPAVSEIRTAGNLTQKYSPAGQSGTAVNLLENR